MHNLLIRNENPADHVAISQVMIEQAFKNQQYSNHTEQYIVDSLRNADALTLSLVAVLNQQIVGQIAISPIKISSDIQGWYGLGSIVVLLKFPQQG
mgnify:CR=1 FL=1